MIEPGVEAEAECRQPLESGAEIRPLVEMRPHIATAVADDRALVPAGRMAHAAEPAVAGADMAQQYRLDAIAQRQIGGADDAAGDPGPPVIARLAHRRDAGDEFGLADRAHLGRTVGAVHRVAFEKDRGDDVMPGREIGEQLVEQIAVIGALPQMMVRIDDRQIGVEHRLRGRGGEPWLVRRVDPAELPVLPGLCHRGPRRVADGKT